VRLESPSGEEVLANRVSGRVGSIDAHGNLVTDISREMLAGAPTDESVSIVCDDHQTFGIFAQFDQQPPLTFIARLGEDNLLTLAIVDENASIMLGVQVGQEVLVSW
jgi:S-adenosylmethionine hydrolase